MIKRFSVLVIFVLLTACASGSQAPAQTPSPETVAELPTTQAVTSTATAVHVPTQTATDVPTQTVTPFVSPITFSNIVSFRQEIPRVVWESAKNEVNSNYKNSRPLVEPKLLVGPNTTLYFKDNEDAFNDATAFWAQFKQPTEYIALFYNFEDRPWAVSEFKKFSFYRERMERMVEGPCKHTPTACNGANSGIKEFSSVGVGVFGIDERNASDTYRFGHIHIHEYTHAVQAAPWIGEDRPNEGPQSMPSACWLIEGQAHFAGLSVGSDSLEEYLQIRERQLKGHPVDSFKDYSAAAIFEFYREKDCIGNPEYDLGYTIGYLTVESLSAIGGPTSSMGLYKRAALGEDFGQAFKHVYGSSWDEAKPILAEVVAQAFNELK